MAMARGHSSLSPSSPCLVTHGIQKTNVTCKQTPRQLTPGPSGTQWLEDLFRQPSQPDEPPIPGPSPSSKPHEDILTCEPEPEVAPTQSMEEPFGPLDPPLPNSATFHSYPGDPSHFPREPNLPSFPQ
ncbi:hypothetical protein O181_051632 [Austropuccinia psidii MF-1]|uniref:Uncharacterized protein n=1 Tax=Austropuccinia psidii MF-1 TaxID=1389203 RepID=A0A9Q3HPR6_9BASI|nr:hypothetical protein [Austropuccinia psidii MF-1]